MNTDEKLTNTTEDLKVLTEIITSMMDHTNNSKFSPSQKDTSKPLDPTTVVPASSRDSTLYRGYSTKIGGVWTLKHDIISPKFYELLIKKNSKDILLWISRNSTTTSGCVLMQWLGSKKTSFLVASPWKYTLILKNASIQIVITLPIPVMSRYTLPLDTHY